MQHSQKTGVSEVRASPAGLLRPLVVGATGQKVSCKLRCELHSICKALHCVWCIQLCWFAIINVSTLLMFRVLAHAAEIGVSMFCSAKTVLQSKQVGGQ